MKRYLLFVGVFYYPSGGWKDFRGDFETIEDAKENIQFYLTDQLEYRWWHIVDTSIGQIISSYDD